jgi:hypothetical protein
MVGVLACIFAMLVAMPVLRAHAAGKLCHPIQNVNVSAAAVHDHASHDQPTSGHDHSETDAVTLATSDAPDGEKPTLQPTCCLPGCGLAVFGSVNPAIPDALAKSKLSLANITPIVGLDPSAPRKPPRTTDIADRKA